MRNDPRPVLVEVCHLIAARNFTTSSGGNISVRMPDGTFWVTPSRLNKARVKIEDLVHIDDQCMVLEGSRMPSSEIPMHLAVYGALPKAGAVVHAHPPTATAYTQVLKSIDTRSSCEAYVVLGPEVPLIPHGRPSTDELGSIIKSFMRDSQQAYLLANHGVLTWGEDLWGAYDVLDTLELFAQTLVVAETLGGAVPLPDEELVWLRKRFCQ